MEEKKGLKYFIRITCTLIAIAAVMAFALAAVNAATKDKIAENNIAEMNAVISKIFGDGIKSEEIEADVSGSVKEVYGITKDGEFQGYAVKCAPMGFKAEIEMIVGVLPDGSCKAVRVISLSETPGLGAKVADDAFISQFDGTSGGLEVKVNINEVAGATISSRAVTGAVNEAIDLVKSMGGEG
ncbi:MAG: FMN-binding protein [Clostridia bacterium]|nr:FMN-binding protein [Clostridia bacterium]